MVRRSLAVGLLTLASCWLAAPAANAAGVCGGDVDVVGTISGYVNPFAPTGSTVTANLTINRDVGGGGAKTNDFHFYFVPHGGTSLPAGSTISYSGSNILNPTGVPVSSPVPSVTASNAAGTLSTDTASPSNYLHVGFGGTSHPNSITFNLTLTLGIIQNAGAGLQTFPLDIVYVCKGTGGFGNVTTPVQETSGAVLMFNVLSGLQATFAGQTTFAGPGLDFGTYGSSTTASGQFDVKSSGVFTIDLASANNFLMTYSGGPTVTPSPGTIKYELGFLGQNNLYNPTPSMTTVSCSPVGVSSFVSIPIQAKLLESGKKNPANYSDALTVTFTPLATTTPDPSNACQSLSDTPPL